MRKWTFRKIKVEKRNRKEDEDNEVKDRWKKREEAEVKDDEEVGE